MKVHRDITELPEISKPVLTIGTFDGVHAGHQQIIERLNHIASAHNGETVLLTFSPHPRIVLSSSPPSLITIMPEKIQLLDYYGIDHLIVTPFTKKFSQQSPRTFIENFLVRHIAPFKIVIGYDHRFGKDRAGDINFMRQVAPELGFEVEEIKKQLVDDISVSSTKIRKAIQSGRVNEAYRLMGHYFPLQGKVIEGDRRGHQLGFPTANIQPPDEHKILPADGVYAVKVKVQNTIYDGVLSLGHRPTFDTTPAIEVYIFDFDQNIYGENIEVYFIEWIRGEESFDSRSNLIKAMKDDTQKASRLLQQDIALPQFTDKK